MALVEKNESFTYDNLFSGTQVQPVVAGKGVIASGQGVLTRGTVLGQLTANSKCVIVDSAAATDDGSRTIYAILAETVDATSADAKAPLYFTGEYNEAALTFGGTDDADTHRRAARNIGIFFKTNISA